MKSRYQFSGEALVSTKSILIMRLFNLDLNYSVIDDPIELSILLFGYFEIRNYEVPLYKTMRLNERKREECIKATLL